MQLGTNTAHTDKSLSTGRLILHVGQHEENYFILFCQEFGPFT